MMNHYSMRLLIWVNDMEQQEFINNVHNFIKLVALYLNDKKAKNIHISSSELSFYFKFAKVHSLRAILYKAVKETECKIDRDQLSKLEEYYLFNVRKSLLFEKDKESLYQFMNDNKIDFLPLKGLVINKYYPDPFIREYADYDILFEGKDHLIKQFFADHGYEVKMFEKSNHDVYVKEPFYNFEMHRGLIGKREDLTQFIDYYKNYMKKAPVKTGYEHELRLEDFYIYFTTHTYKHYIGGGCGVRTLIDYYVFLRSVDLDFEYINEELDKLGLREFSDKFKTLSKKLFDDEILNEEEEEMLLYIASSGTYGTTEHHVAKVLERKSKFRYILSRIFPPMEVYRIRYPFLYKTKILIPLAWLLRLLQSVTIDRKKSSTELKAVRKVKKKD